MAPFYSQTNYLEIKRHTYTIGDIGNGTREVGEQTDQKAGNTCRNLAGLIQFNSKASILVKGEHFRS